MKKRINNGRCGVAGVLHFRWPAYLLSLDAARCQERTALVHPASFLGRIKHLMCDWPKPWHGRARRFGCAACGTLCCSIVLRMQPTPNVDQTGTRSSCWKSSKQPVASASSAGDNQKVSAKVSSPPHLILVHHCVPANRSSHRKQTNATLTLAPSSAASAFSVQSVAANLLSVLEARGFATAHARQHGSISSQRARRATSGGLRKC